MLIPAVEAAEHPMVQRVVPFETQRRVFGFAMTFEAAAAADRSAHDRTTGRVLDHHPVYGFAVGAGRLGFAQFDHVILLYRRA